MNDTEAEVTRAHLEMAEAAARYREACRVQIQWACAGVRAELAAELAAAMGLKGELGWSAVLQHVAILVGQSDAARKRRQRAKAPAKRRKVKRRIRK